MTAIRLNDILLKSFSQLFSEIKRTKKSKSQNQILLTALTTGKSLHLLLVDDDEEDCDLFSEAIKMVNPHIKSTIIQNSSNLLNSLKKLSNNLPDIVFLDLNMAGKDGIQCLDEIKTTPLFSEIPVIIYSTSAYRDHLDTTYKKGANLYIQKPDTFSGIQKILKRVLAISPADLHLQPSKQNFLFR
jgi:CheY-like chemotaxis protein